MNTGENLQGLRQVLDFTRLLSLAVLLLHSYIVCYTAFRDLGLTHPLVDRVAWNAAQMSLFQEPWRAKAAAGLLLLVSLLGARGKKEERLRYRHLLGYLLPGLALYSASHLLLLSTSTLVAAAYLGTTLLGYLLLLAGGTRCSRLLLQRLSTDIFNHHNQSFPQEERLMENEYSVNLPAE